MADSRIKVAKDKADLVKALTASDDTTGPFQTYADVLVFAAALGAKRSKRSPLGEISKRDPAPIHQETFTTRGYEPVIKLLAMAETQDKQILSANDEEYDDKRTHIFEEYANGGLEVLRSELRGAVDYTERILLILISDRFNRNANEEIDLGSLI